MADNSNPLGTDIASAQQAIKAMMTPLDEDNVVGGDAQGDEPEADYAQSEAQAEEAYEAEPDVGEDTEDYSDDDLDEQPRTYRVKVNGEEIEVTEDELLNGYSRQQDYTRKSQELAERRKAVEALEQEIEAERYQYAELLPRMRQQLEQQLQAEPDWDKLYEQNPIEATKLERQWRQAKDQREAQIRAVEEEQARLAQIQQRKLQAEMQKHLQAEAARLTELIPEWKDTNVAQKEHGEIRDFLFSKGFSEQDVEGIQHAGVVALARNAMLYERGLRKITEAKEGRKSDSPKQMKPGSRGSQPRKRSDVEKAQTRLRQTGRVADAASVIKSLL
jgi:hypothetical protein